MDKFDWKRPDEGDADKPEQSQWPDALSEAYSRQAFLDDAGREENDCIQDGMPSDNQQSLVEVEQKSADENDKIPNESPEARTYSGLFNEQQTEFAPENAEQNEPPTAEKPQGKEELEQEPTLQESPLQENLPEETPAVLPDDAAQSEQDGTKPDDRTQQNQYSYGSVYGQPAQEQPQHRPYGFNPNGEEQENPQQRPYADPQNGWMPPTGYPPYPPPYGYPPYPPQGERVPFGYQPPRVYAPYGGGMGNSPEFTPKPIRSKGYRLFIGMLITLGAVFVFGFFSLSLYTAFTPDDSTASSQTPQEPPQSPESEASPQIPDTAEPAPTGVLTDPRFAGITVLPIPTSDESTAKAIYKAVSPSIIGVVCEMPEGTSSGSGIICREDGYIITNSHVIKDSKQLQKLRVILHDNTQYNAAVVGFDKTTDLAVLKIDAKNLPVASFGNSDKLEVGDWVLAIGNPGGMTFASSLSRGVVSGLNRSVGYSEKANMTYIQTDTAISPGASGGALFNLYGQVVGVNTSKLVAEGYEGMGFSIPIARAKGIVDDLIQNGYVSGRARLGIGANQVSSIQQQLGWPQGVVIASIDSNSAFSGTEAKVGDIITKVDGKQISTMAELYQKLGLHKSGEKMTVSIYRPGKVGQSGRTFDVTVTLLADTGDTQKTIQIK